MPTLNMGNGGLEDGSVEKVAKKPSGLRAAMKNAGLVLSIMGATVVTDANGQQVAVATVPQQPGQIGGPAVPGEGGITTSEIPTAEMIIKILKEEETTIKRKFPTCTDEALAKMAGEIALGTIDLKRLETLAGAFKEGSEERKALIDFAKVTNASKPPTDLASAADGKKLPPFNETKKDETIEEKKEKRKQEIRLKELNEILGVTSKKFFSERSWSSPQKPFPATITAAKNVIRTEFSSKDPSVKRADICFSSPISNGKYEIAVAYSGDGTVGFWVYDKFEKPIFINGADRTFLQNGNNPIVLPQGAVSIRFGLFTTPTSKTPLEVTKFNIKAVQ